MKKRLSSGVVPSWLWHATITIFFASGATLYGQVTTGQAQATATGEETKKSYTRFLELPAGIGDSVKLPIPKNDSERAAFREALKEFSEKFSATQKRQSAFASPERAAATDAVKAGPNRASQLSRLLKNQEKRTPQPDAANYLAETPLLAEVADSVDKDFAQVIFWNEVAVNLTANDHTPLPQGATLNTNPFEQVGPAKTSRALAIVHIAIFEAMNAALRKYESYKTADGITTIQQKIFSTTGFPPTKPASEISLRTAIAYAAYHSLLGVYPKKSGYLAPILVENLAQVGDPDIKKNAGQAIGEAAAAAILGERVLDGSEYSIEEPPVQIFSSPDPAKWKKDPLNADPDRALGALWPLVRPFASTREELAVFRPPPPPPLDLNDTNFKAAYDEVHRLGGDPKAGKSDPPGNKDRRETPTDRDSTQEFIAKFWAYDATALLCAPPRLYNMLATSIALKERPDKFPDGLELARYLALVNIALADAGIGAWDAKYYYRYPRPVTGIRDLAKTDTADKFWTPLGAPVSNAKADKVNFTPPFPSYPSGHAVFGAALFEVLREFYGKDDQPFEFVSDEYNGKNRDAGSATPRPLMPRKFDSFTKAEEENGQSRIYLGIHWQFDAKRGYEQGRKIGGKVFKTLYRTVP
jgi:PAP2 superfamily